MTNIQEALADMKIIKEQVIAMVADNKQLRAEVELRGFKISNLTTERDVANQEIERLKGATITDVRHYDRAITPTEVELNYQLTAANAKMEKLRDVLEKIAESGEYENNSLGNKVKGPKLFPTQMWWLAKQALADSEEGK